MVSLEICGIPVEFPFRPYDSQLVYMEKVVLSLMSKQNAILESPTGTGKTLCLLCATLAWRQELQKKLKTSTLVPTKCSIASLGYEGYDSSEESIVPQLPRIIYSSRTHSQLKQVVQELKNTSYRPNVAVLGSREHLCVNDKVSKLRGTRQNLACRSTCKDRRCNYKLGFDIYAKRSRKQAQPIMDIEELVTSMKEKSICPFFLTRNMLPEAEIVFVPYNYLIDPLARRSIGMSLDNSILIFDEAHNVETIASDAASYALSSNDISGCISEIDTFIKALGNNTIQLDEGSNLTTESIQTLRALFLEIDKSLKGFPLSANGGFTKPGQYIFEFFEQFNVNFETCPLVLNMIEEIIEVAHGSDDSQRAASRLDSILSFLGTVFRSKEQHLKTAQNYRVHIQEIRERPLNTERLFKGEYRNKTTTRVFNYWCFHPGIAFREICANNIHNVILTSGTLSPLDTTVKELGIDFPVRLENSHVIDASQVWVGVVGTGVTGKRLNSSYNFRSTEAYLLELGNTIYRQVAATCTGGRLDFKMVVDEYHQTIANDPRGAIFFAVCRGKVSEGIDFSNDKGRAVVITGLPFPPTKDPRIILKKSILDEAVVHPGELKLTGNAWYIQQASRAVNQAIGRVIRHRHDFGAIILLDERFALKQQQECHSKWLQPYCHTCSGYGEAHIGLTRFFRTNKLRGESESSTKVLQQPKSIGLSGRGKAQSPMARSDGVLKDVSQQPNSPPEVQSNSQIAIGDGQSYVDPQVLRRIPDPSITSEDKKKSDILARSRPLAPQKRSLGSLLMSKSKSAMVDMTSSISRPFTASTPSTVNCNTDSADSATTFGGIDAQSWHSARQEFAANQNAVITVSNVESSTTSTVEFPAVARKVLSASDVLELYSYIRQLHAGEDVDAALKNICTLLRDPACKELLDLMPIVLNGELGNRFIEEAKVHGLKVSVIDGKSRGNSAEGRPTNVTTFFENLQQKKRKRQRGDATTGAFVRNPQCFVCYDITLKAYASPLCGHICCQICWKKMEKDGFTSCPVCKIPIKLQQLSLIRAAKIESESDRVDGQ
ncbi:regulator of telomere elongation helicase 1-like isoform x2 [Plasmopara halstedii]|uniref:Regulator of telomere elongation helicase 1-like isoform x2 n=1 Tax=Plasmopara halstedii TaxID=4781 RepID=A0A0P1B461_PLAHL|nr:regulator of telomere elongation helicase 1-like isoform x2 [Plasmopara halstedii]CEG49566.1 regulator of telomere elongation helicase 1-like isoform x2 [Plasmopara halstedii]|eukprot:XP_024585935.1 regulator of telomere elongation helicase 1-like isoform x2 [Plasmopara halstedii]